MHFFFPSEKGWSTEGRSGVRYFGDSQVSESIPTCFSTIPVPFPTQKSLPALNCTLPKVDGGKNPDIHENMKIWRAKKIYKKITRPRKR